MKRQPVVGGDATVLTFFPKIAPQMECPTNENSVLDNCKTTQEQNLKESMNAFLEVDDCVQ